MGWVHTKRGSLQITIPEECFTRCGTVTLQVHSTHRNAKEFIHDPEATPIALKECKFTQQSRSILIRGADKNPWGKSSKDGRKVRVLFQLVATQSGSTDILARSLPFCLYRDRLDDRFKSECVSALALASSFLAGQNVVDATAAKNRNNLAERVNHFWESIRRGRQAIDCQEEWERELHTMWHAGLGEWGNYASFTNWWLECLNDKQQKDMALQHLARAGKDVKDDGVVYALPFFHLKHNRIAWMCLTHCDVAKAAIQRVKLGANTSSKSLYLLKTHEVIHIKDQVALKLPATDQSIPTF